MSDSHDVSFRSENDQPCPNCGAVVEKFKATRAYPEYRYWAGYECTECDVRWDWEEWADGVEKLPDPDPQHQASDLERRKIGHAYMDIMGAIEGGRFQVETPRVHVGKDTFDNLDWGIERDTERHHSRTGLCGVSVGPPYLTISMEWSPEDHTLLEDLRQHGALEGPCILYGDMHLWQMEEQYGHKVQAWVNTDGSEPAASAEFEWHAVDDIGWR